MQKQRISEIITIDKIRQWDKGDIITIKAGTGTGKSYFIKNILYAFAKKENKKILMLIHRVNCVNQFQDEIERDNKTDIIHIKTYQSIEYMHKNHVEFDFSEYEYIVCDEFHYFMSDAAFNKITDMSLNAILGQTDKIRIFMSATGNYMRRYINNFKGIETINYELPIDYNFIKTLTFFYKNETLEKFIEECIELNDKAIFFIQSAEKAYNLFKKYKKYCLFNCSKSNKTYYKYVDEDKINNMLKNEKFEEQILITTTTMDSGVNIKDTDVKHIVCDVKDIGVLIQCLGRRRINNKIKNDGINIYIKAINNNVLGGILTQLQKKVEMAEYLKEHTVKEYLQKYNRKLDYSHIVYDDIVEYEDNCTKKINELMYFKCLIDITTIKIMLNFGKFGYVKYMSDLFGIEKYRLIEEEYKKETLEDYLEIITGKKLYKEEQKELIDVIDLRVNRRQQKSYRKLNEGLKMIELPYIILPKKSNSKRYWIVEKIDM